MFPSWEKDKHSAVVVICSCDDRHTLEGRRVAQDLRFVSNHGLENGCIKYHKHRAEHLVYCMQGNPKVVKFGPRIGMVGCKLEIGNDLEHGIGLPSAFGYSQAFVDDTAVRLAVYMVLWVFCYLPAKQLDMRLISAIRARTRNGSKCTIQ